MSYNHQQHYYPNQGSNDPRQGPSVSPKHGSTSPPAQYPAYGQHQMHQAAFPPPQQPSSAIEFGTPLDGAQLKLSCAGLPPPVQQHYPYQPQPYQHPPASQQPPPRSHQQNQQSQYNGYSQSGPSLPYSPSPAYGQAGRPPVPPRPHPPPPPPGAAAPQYGRIDERGSAMSPYARHSSQSSREDNSNIISMYGSPSDTASAWQASPAPTLNRAVSAGAPSIAGSLRPQYPQTPYSASAVPSITAASQVHPTQGTHSPSHAMNEYSAEARRSPETVNNRPSFNSASPGLPPRPLSSGSRQSVDRSLISSNWATPVQPGSTEAAEAYRGSPTTRDNNTDRIAMGKQVVAEAAGGGADAYHAERRDVVSDHMGRPGGSPTVGAGLYASRQPTIRTTPAAPPPRSESFSSQNNRPSATSSPRQGTLSPNSSLTAGGSASWGIFRDDSFGSTTEGGTSASYAGGHEFLNAALLSNVAVFVKDLVPRGLNLKGMLEFPDSFTGEQLVNTVQKALAQGSSSDRRHALQIARSLQQALWFNEVDWSDAPVKDSSATVYTFENAFEELPTGVVTTQTRCYSPFCGKLNEEGLSTTCYSYACPNMVRNRLQRMPSIVSSAPTEASEEAGDNWLSSVPQSVRDSVDKRETKRQLVIFELVSTEKMYNVDLDVVQEGFVEPLLAATPPIIPPERQTRFLHDVLQNLAEIRKLNHAFLDRLLARQREGPVVRSVGDLMLAAAPEWRSAYIEYAHKFNLAEAILKEEKVDNPRFGGFLMEFHKFPKAGRQNFESFHKRPTLRLLRYTLILKEILKHTPEDHPDHAWITQSVDIIHETGMACNASDPLVESKVACRTLYRAMRRRPGDNAKDTDRVVQELELLADSRRHFHSGRVFRRPDGATFTDWSENHLILFDHYLLYTKAKERDGSTDYRITRRPIPLELLQFRPTSFVDPPITRSSGFHLRTGNFPRLERSTSDGTSGSTQPESSTLVFPITLYKIGRNEGTITFYVESKTARDTWEQKLREALELRTKTQEANRVVQLDPLSDRTFTVHPDRPPTCSAPLTLADGQSLVIAGCESGLFIGFRGQTMKQVVALQGITQCAVLQEFGLVIVLAQGALIAYALEALIPSGRASDPSLRTPQRLSGKTPANFFRVGKVTDSSGKPLTLVIYNKKGGVKESVFKALEPISVAERQRGSHKGFFGGSKNPEWFRTHKDFFLPSVVTSVQFLRSKLAIVLARGVEIMDLTTLRTMSVPDFTKYRHDPGMLALQKRCDEAKTLGMFRLADNLFLLVFDEFAFHVDKHGEPIAGRAGSIDWESKPESVAFQLPYIYAFSSNLVEIRHAMTGQLVQVIPGQAISLLYDGTGIDPNVLEVRTPSRLSSGQSTLLSEPPDRRIHFTMRAGEHYKVFEINPASS